MMSLTTPENCQAGDTRRSAMRQRERKAVTSRKLGVDKSVECVVQSACSLTLVLPSAAEAALDDRCRALPHSFERQREMAAGEPHGLCVRRAE
jgi:hypothetical protein